MIKPLFLSKCLLNDCHSFHITLLANDVSNDVPNSRASLYLFLIFSLIHQMFCFLGWILYNLKFPHCLLLSLMSRHFILSPICIYSVLILYMIQRLSYSQCHHSVILLLLTQNCFIQHNLYFVNNSFQLNKM